jgi:hypothetical protein
MLVDLFVDLKKNEDAKKEEIEIPKKEEIEIPWPSKLPKNADAQRALLDGTAAEQPKQRRAAGGRLIRRDGGTSNPTTLRAPAATCSIEPDWDNTVPRFVGHLLQTTAKMKFQDLKKGMS